MSDPQRSPNSILVTGGSGFIGSSFIRQTLARNDFTGTIVNADKLTYAANQDNLPSAGKDSRYVFSKTNICDEEKILELVEEHAIDTVVNFAAESHVDRSIHGPAIFIETNIVGTFHLLEAVRKQPHVHFHHVSTDEVYGSLADTGLFHETTPYQPNSPYAASKASSDHLVRAYAHTFGISTTISNCSNNYGPYQFPEKLIPLMILNCLEGKDLPVYGDGKNVRDWLYVDDHAVALWTILRFAQKGTTYNIGGDNEQKNLDIVHRIAELVAELTQQDSEKIKRQITFVKDRPGHDWRYAIDCTRLKTDFGWNQKHDFTSGLRKTVMWYIDNPQWVERVRSGAYRDWIEANYGGR